MRNFDRNNSFIVLLLIHFFHKLTKSFYVKKCKDETINSTVCLDEEISKNELINERINE